MRQLGKAKRRGPEQRRSEGTRHLLKEIGGVWTKAAQGDKGRRGARPNAQVTPTRRKGTSDLSKKKQGGEKGGKTRGSRKGAKGIKIRSLANQSVYSKNRQIGSLEVAKRGRERS